MEKVVIQAAGGDQKPMLFFKYDRSAVFVVTENLPENTDEYLYIRFLECYVLLAEDWLKSEKTEWIGGF